MFAEFELKINQIVESGQSLTADMLNQTYAELNRLYFGDDVVIDDEIALEWSRIPHFYYNFYVYQYATGFSSAIALSRRILTEGEPAVKDYINFLKGGCSKDPAELLKGAGVDVLSGDVVSSALELFGELVDELDDLLS
jgi:oligoendopeptidase F